jgi:hypothetical protein
MDSYTAMMYESEMLKPDDYKEAVDSPVILRVMLFIAIVLLGAINANNVFPSSIGLIISQANSVVLAIALFIFGFLGRGWKIKMPPEAKLTLGFVIWSISGFWVARHLPYFIECFVTLVKTVGLYLIIINIVRTRKDFLWMSLAYISTVLLLFFMGSEIISEAGASGERAAGTVGDANGLAAWGIIGLFASFVCFASVRSKIFKVFSITALPIFLIMVLKSGSRSGMVGIILFFVLVYVFFIRGQIREKGEGAKIGGFLVGILILGVICTIVIQSSFWERVQRTIGTGKFEGKAQEDIRIPMILGGIKLTLQHPILGVGYGQYRVAIGEVDLGLASTGLVSHTTWVDASTGGGLVGLALWFIAYFILTKRIWKLWKNPYLNNVDRGVVSLCLVFISFWWFRSLFFSHLGEKTLLPIIAGMTGYLTTLSERYNYCYYMEYLENFNFNDHNGLADYEYTYKGCK